MNVIKQVLPYIETERLILREIKRSDARSVFEYAKDPRVGPNAGWKPHVHEDESIEFINYAIKKRDLGQPGILAIILKENFKMIGTIEIHSFQGYKGEIGFVLHPEFWNKGYITEAAKAVIVYGMEILELKRLTYCHFPHNLQSKRVCEKLGFIYEGTLRNKFLLYDGSVLHDVTYSLTPEDYQRLAWVEPFKKGLFVDY